MNLPPESVIFSFRNKGSFASVKYQQVMAETEEGQQSNSFVTFNVFAEQGLFGFKYVTNANVDTSAKPSNKLSWKVPDVFQ